MDKLAQAAQWALARIKEPSTHAALAVGIQMLKSHYPQYADAIDWATGFFVLVAGALAEGKTEPPLYTYQPSQPPKGDAS